MTNAESFGLFVQDLGTGRVTSLTAPTDTLEDCQPEWQHLILNAIARAQIWNRNAQTMTAHRRPTMLSEWTNLQNTYLGATTSDVLYKAERTHYKVSEELNSPIHFKCKNERGGLCDKGAGMFRFWSYFLLCPAWKDRRTEDERVLSMLVGLYEYLADPSSKVTPLNYALLARDLNFKKQQ